MGTIVLTYKGQFKVMATDSHSIKSVGDVLRNPKCHLKERFRALFTLKNLGGKEAISEIGLCFADESDLLKHECAYCLGQMQDETAIPILTTVLKDTTQAPIVRHEAGEALGAIGAAACISVLEEYCTDPCVEVAETCQLAVQRIQWLHSDAAKKEVLSENPYQSVDPAPPCTGELDIDKLRACLLDNTKPLFDRYRAMFTLRNDGSKDAVLALADGLTTGSPLFRHEIAYVLGQIQSEHSVSALKACLRDTTQLGMVRHECAEALGSIATPDCMSILEEYAADQELVVQQSCEVALDMCEYESSGQFQYADTMLNMIHDPASQPAQVQCPV